MFGKDHEMSIKLPKRGIILFIIILASVYLLAAHDYALYKQPIAKLQSVKTQYVRTQTGSDGTYEYDERVYKQTLTGVIMNGKYKGKTIRMTNTCTGSQVYDTRYSRGDSVFVTIDHGQESTSSSSLLSGGVNGLKRDYLILTILTALFGLFLLVGDRYGILTILSLILNMGAFYIVLLLHQKGYNILFLTIPMTIFFTGMLLLFMLGKNEKTLISFAATIVTVAITTLIAGIVMQFGGRIDYDFMDYLIQPYTQHDANLIFLSEILVGGLGAIMDVVVTIVMTVSELVDTGTSVTRSSLLKSCRAVGDDLVGTMINLMFFTNIASCIPAFILYMRNGIHFTTILHYNIFFELARFLTGSIGTVLAIPGAAFLAIRYYERKHMIEPSEGRKNA